MIRYFCDGCHEEIPHSFNRLPLVLTLHNGEEDVKVEVDPMVTINSTTNAGHICLKCIRKVVRKGTLKRR